MLVALAGIVAALAVKGTASAAANDPAWRRACLLPTQNETGQLDGHAEQELIEDLAGANESYANHFDAARFDGDLTAAFRRYGLDVDQVDPELAGKRFSRRASTSEIASGIDHWCWVRRTRLNDLDWRRLAEVARAADPDIWRNALRDQFDRSAGETLEALRTLAADAEAVEKQPSASLRVLALLLKDAGDHSTSASVLRVAARRSANHFRVWLELGTPHDPAAEDYDPIDQALAKLEHQRGNQPVQAANSPRSDQPLVDRDSLAEIVFPARRSVVTTPHTVAAFYNRGITYAQKKEYDKALCDFNAVIKLDPQFSSAYIVRAEIWLTKSEADHAIADFTEALRIERQPNAYRGRGFAWLEKKNFANAIDDFNEAIRLAPEDGRSYCGRGYAWAGKKEFDKARIDFDNAIRLDALYSEAYVARGHAWSSQKEFDKAVADFDDAIRLEPQNANAYTGRGFVWSQKNDYQKAIADYEKAVLLNPNDPGALNGRAWLWATCTDHEFRDGKKALEAAKKACELTEHADALIVDTLAAAFAESGDFALAVKWQRKAIEILTDDKFNHDFRTRLALYEQKKPYHQSALE
jgi:tetratricopeptide (TPR) repeat protein